MKYIGMLLGGILSAIGHMFGFFFKNIYISIRRYTMDPANKKSLWNLQAFSTLILLLFAFLWLVTKYQDVIFGASEPVFFRAIPLVISCLLGHTIYSCPALFKNTYAKPVIQNFLNSLSILALGQIIMKYIDVTYSTILTLIMLIGSIVISFRINTMSGRNSTLFNKLTQVVEQERVQSKKKDKVALVENIDNIEFDRKQLDDIDLNSIDYKGSLERFRYYSEECKLELFITVPTKSKQSQLVTLSRTDRAQHSQFIGGTGAGKTLLQTNLAVQDLLNDYIGVTIIDPKGSLIQRLSYFNDRTGRPYYRLDPTYEFTDCFNPLFVPEGQDIEPMIEANVSAYHGYLGPEALQYFKSRTTNLLRVGIKALKLAYGNDCGYNELNNLVQPMNDEYRAEVLAILREKGFDNQVPLLQGYTRDLAGSQKTQEHTMQTYSSLHDYLLELTSNKHIQKILCGKSTFNIDDALEKGEIIFVNGAYGTLQTLTYTVGRLFLNLMRASVFRRGMSGDYRPHQLIIDEIEMFADEEFSTFLEMAREYEVFVNLIHQGNAQLDDVSRRLGAMVRQNAVQKFLLAGLENDDAEYYADMIGENYQIGQSSGTDEMSTSGFKTQIREEKRYKVMPSEIQNLKGFNPETGEPGECLFRGVHNNVRLEPVIGLVTPLPRRLFSPIIEIDEHEQDLVLIDEHDNDSEVIPAASNMLMQIKEKAFKQKESVEEVAINEVDPQIVEVSEKEESNKRVRNSAWDDTDEIEMEINEPEELNKEKDKEKEESSPLIFQPATINNKAIKLAEKIKNASESKRKE